MKRILAALIVAVAVLAPLTACGGGGGGHEFGAEESSASEVTDTSASAETESPEPVSKAQKFMAILEDEGLDVSARQQTSLINIAAIYCDEAEHIGRRAARPQVAEILTEDDFFSPAAARVVLDAAEEVYCPDVR